MRTPPVGAVALVAAVTLAACAGSHRPPSEAFRPSETITVAVGPCFGFCPVYSVNISPKGLVRFEGQRHTAVLGERTHIIGEADYRKLAGDLAGFRPASGSDAVVDCTAAVSDTSAYTVTWADAANHRTTTTVQSGCPGGAGHALAELLRNLPVRLGIEDLARQTTRPGVSRG
jgi:hypothetical protein